jgi:diguanylate cyclase
LHTAVELDFLTGVGNRRALERKLAEHAQERRPHLESSLLLLDLDHFKQINDLLRPSGRRPGAETLVRIDAAPYPLVGLSVPLWRRGIRHHSPPVPA